MKQVCLDQYYYKEKRETYYCVLPLGHKSGHDYRSKSSTDYKRAIGFVKETKEE